MNATNTAEKVVRNIRRKSSSARALQFFKSGRSDDHDGTWSALSRMTGRRLNRVHCGVAVKFRVSDLGAANNGGHRPGGYKDADAASPFYEVLWQPFGCGDDRGTFLEAVKLPRPFSTDGSVALN